MTALRAMDRLLSATPVRLVAVLTMPLVMFRHDGAHRVFDYVVFVVLVFALKWPPGPPVSRSTD